jgi:hypothetical protein
MHRDKIIEWRNKNIEDIKIWNNYIFLYNYSIKKQILFLVYNL